jgi:hypothetical protein
VREVGGSHVSHSQVARCRDGQASVAFVAEGADVKATGSAASDCAFSLSKLDSSMLTRVGLADTFGGASDASRCSVLRARNDTACRRCPVALVRDDAEVDPAEAVGGTGQTNGPASRVGEGEMTLMEGTEGWCTKPGRPSLGLVRTAWRESAAAKAMGVFMLEGEQG